MCCILVVVVVAVASGGGQRGNVFGMYFHCSLIGQWGWECASAGKMAASLQADHHDDLCWMLVDACPSKPCPAPIDANSKMRQMVVERK